MRTRLSTVLACVVVIAVAAIAGCVSGSTTSGQKTAGTPRQRPASMRLSTVEQWTQSAHARVVTEAAARPECARCHDGETFAQTSVTGTATPGSSTTSAPPDGQEESATAGEEAAERAPRDWLVATDCRVCHTATGARIAESGVTTLPGVAEAKGGRGALCMTCHNSRRQADPANADRPAPHYSPAADLLLGVNVMQTGGQIGRSPHAKVGDTCVGCHMRDEKGALSHRFTFGAWSGCRRSGCHGTDPTKAKQDYDGDGTIEKYQDEVDGMLEAAQSGIEKRAGGTFASERGRIVFKTAGGAPIAKVDDQVYAAAYDYLLILNDGSRGVHNPKGIVSVLKSLAASATP